MQHTFVDALMFAGAMLLALGAVVFDAVLAEARERSEAEAEAE